jgi:catechol 2,3-dioxygenase
VIDPGVDIGHLHPRVSDLHRSLAFYRDVLGFDLVGQVPGAMFLSAGGYHHHIALNTFESAGGAAPPVGSTGLYHFAIRFPSRASLASVVRRLVDAGWPVDHASEHGALQAVYLDDPDGNGIELSWDRPPEEWPRDAEGRLVLVNEPLELEAILEGA